MKRGVAGMSLEGSDFMASVDAIDKAGYDVIEMSLDPIRSFLKEGHTIKEMADKLASVSCRLHVVCAILDIEIPEGPKRKDLIASYHEVCEIAAGIGCPHIQMVSGATFAGSPWETIRKETARGLREMADIAGEYGVRALYEPIAWWPVKTAAQAVEVVDEAGRDNVGILIDTFHIFASEDDLDSIRELDPERMPTVHLGDCMPRKGDVWSDLEREPMPGDGIIPLKDILEAILASGYDGAFSDEIWPHPYSDRDRTELFETLKEKGDAALATL